MPIIHFGTETAGMLPLIREAGGDVIGVDWRIELDAAWRMLGPEVAVQGNLDPVALFAPWPQLRTRAQHVLDAARARGLAGAHLQPGARHSAADAGGQRAPAGGFRT